MQDGAGGGACGGKCISRSALTVSNLEAEEAEEAEDEWECQKCGHVTQESLFFATLFQEYKHRSRAIDGASSSWHPPEMASPRADDRMLWLRLEDKWVDVSYSKAHWSLDQVRMRVLGLDHDSLCLSWKILTHSLRVVSPRACTLVVTDLLSPAISLRSCSNGQSKQKVTSVCITLRSNDCSRWLLALSHGPKKTAIRCDVI